MKKFIIFLLSVLLMFVSVLANTLIGGIIGWIIGLFFEETILGILASIGIKGFSMFQIGIFLGFISCFYKTLIEWKRKP